jgi:hypothetical protein
MPLIAGLRARRRFRVQEFKLLPACESSSEEEERFLVLFAEPVKVVAHNFLGSHQVIWSVNWITSPFSILVTCFNNEVLSPRTDVSENTARDFKRYGVLDWLN